MGLFRRNPNIEKLKIKRDIKGFLNILKKNSPSYELEREIVDALKEIKEPAINFLVTSLKEKINDPIRYDAWALGEIGDKRAVEPLIQALKEGNHYLQRAAADALGKIGDSRAVEPLIQALRTEKTLTSISYNIAEALGKIRDTRAVEPLIQVLKDNIDFYLARVVALALGEIGDSRAIEPLKQALRKGNRSLQEDAKQALAKISSLGTE